MLRSVSWLAWSLSLLCLPLVACDGTTDDPRCAQLTAAEKGEVGDALGPLFRLLGGEEESIPGVTLDVIEEPRRATVTYAGYIVPESGVAVSGALDLNNAISGATAKLSVSGVLYLTGGELAELSVDLRAELPWDPVVGDFAGEPISIAGSFTLDASQCGIQYFPALDPDAPPAVDPQFVVAGMGGTIVYSEDGSEWGYPNVVESDTLGTAENLYGVACDETGVCVVVGGAGVAFRSTDGVQWQSAPSGATQRLNGVAGCDGTWIAVGQGGVAHGSTDQGASWSSLTTGTTADLAAIACHQGVFVAVGGDGAVVTGSGAGLAPVSPPPMAAPLTAVATDGAGTWVAVGLGGALARSTDDAQTWQPVPQFAPVSLAGIAHGGGRFIAVGPGPSEWGTTPFMYASTDGGLTFAAVTLPAELLGVQPARPLAAVATDGAGRWSVVGSGGDYLLSVDDGASWQVAGLDLYGSFGIAYRRPAP